MVKKLNVGLIGLGTVGLGVLDILKENSNLIEQRTGVAINVIAACTRTQEKAEKAGVDMTTFTTDYNEIINNTDVDIVVELIGGYEPARTIIMDAIKAKKNVVTANKAVISKFGYEIYEAAQANGVNVLFEAAVGGCIPILRSIEETYNSDRITNIYGILNGTTNYMLTKMTEGQSYEDALKTAQELGFAESDPTFDVEGLDCGQKLGIAASLAFDVKIDSDYLVEGITKISKKDIDYAKELGYTIKLISMGKRYKDKVELRSHPTMIPSDHVLAGVNNEYNAFLFSGKYVDEVMLSGKGAGKYPTASVVVSDLIEVGSRTRVAERHFKEIELVAKEDIVSRYYLRLNVLDKPGVMASIAKQLGDNDVSISAIHQKETNKEVVPVIILTHETREGKVIAAFDGIKELGISKEELILIRIDELI